MSSGSEKLSPFGKSLDENRKSRPRQFARRPATGSERVCPDVVPFMTKIYFSSWGRVRVPSGSDLSVIPDFDFVTKVDFSLRGLGGDSAERYLIARRSHSPDENRPCFRSGGQRGCCSDLAHWVWSAVTSVENFSLHLYALHPKLSVLWVKILLRSVGACPCLLREYVRCHIYMTDHFSHITVLYVCLFSMSALTLISKSPAHSHFDMIILTDF